jgi:hypothetical protein
VIPQTGVWLLRDQFHITSAIETLEQAFSHIPCGVEKHELPPPQSMEGYDCRIYRNKQEATVVLQMLRYQIIRRTSISIIAVLILLASFQVMTGPYGLRQRAQHGRL